MRDWVSKLVVALVVTLLLLPGVSHALTDEQKALVGLHGVLVRVDAIKPEAERLGLKSSQIKTDAELRLRKAGVRVLTNEEWEKTPGGPYLDVMITTDLGFSRHWAYRVDVSLHEIIPQAIGYDANGFPKTGHMWSSKLGESNWGSNIKEIRGAVGDQIDAFINDYLAANPKN
jgi:hypothetical protein